MRYETKGYVQPQCEYAGCDRGADFRDDMGKLACSRCARTRCACGGTVPEALVADGFQCDACDMARDVLADEWED